MKAQRDDHFHGKLVGALLGAQEPAVAHIIAEGAQSIPTLSAEID